MFCSLVFVATSGSLESVVDVCCLVGNSSGIVIGVATGGSR